MFGLLHAAGAFHDPCLLVDEAKQQHLDDADRARTPPDIPGSRTAVSRLCFSTRWRGQAYREFVQRARGPGVTANLTIDYCAPMPTESHVLVVAKLQSVDRARGKCGATSA